MQAAEINRPALGEQRVHPPDITRESRPAGPAFHECAPTAATWVRRSPPRVLWRGCRGVAEWGCRRIHRSREWEVGSGSPGRWRGSSGSRELGCEAGGSVRLASLIARLVRTVTGATGARDHRLVARRWPDRTRQFVPLVVFGLYGGSIADAVDRRKLVLVTSAGTMLASVILLVQAVLQLNQGGVLFACVVVQPAFTAVDSPIRRAIIPQLVPARSTSYRSREPSMRRCGCRRCRREGRPTGRSGLGGGGAPVPPQSAPGGVRRGGRR